jgi:hypothetical protein
VSDRNNTNYKLLVTALGLSHEDVARLLHEAGHTVGLDHVRRWSRSADAGAGRYSVMSDAEFDTFCRAVSRAAYLARHPTA